MSERIRKPRKIVITGDLDPMYEIKELCMCPEGHASLTIEMTVDLDTEKLWELLEQLSPITQWRYLERTRKENLTEEEYANVWNEWIWKLTLEPIKMIEKKERLK